MTESINDLIASVSDYNDRSIADLLSYAVSHDLPRDSYILAAQAIRKHNKGTNYRLTIGAAGLFRKGGDLRAEREIFEKLAEKNYAPAIHLLGRIYTEEDPEKALVLFLKAKQLGYDLGATAYHAFLRRRTHFPVSLYHRLQSIRYRMRSRLRTLDIGAADEIMMWDAHNK